MWTRDSLHGLIDEKLRGYKFIVVSNREPYIHHYSGGQIRVETPASGMATALDPILRTSGGTWIAHGSGDADRYAVDGHDRLEVPPDDPLYTLRRVWLTKEEEQGYYYGASNASIWPLCHVVYTRPVFDQKDWQRYREVNEKFRDAVLDEAGSDPTFVFIQDYHLALLPRMLRESNSASLIIAQFWHIPWPNHEIFRTMPWAEEMLDGLLGNDLLGFHLRYDCQNFLESVDRVVEAKVNQPEFEITRGGRTTLIRPFPISIAFDEHNTLARSSAVEDEMNHWENRLRLRPGDLVGIGIDRIDYTKGIPERLRAVDTLLERCPEYRERLVFVQIGVPSRIHLHPYKQLNDEIEALVEEINWRWRSGSWQPIVFLCGHHSQKEMAALHRLSSFCVVNALHDGMNLVAKEYVASRFDSDGVLILSQFTGASRELTDALLVNPFSVEETAQAIRQALEMPAEERARRMQKMREMVAANNIYRWAGKFLSALLRFDFAETPLSPAPKSDGAILV
ncbi:MAG TPA: trehalose-6-phosphate synthase [Bryobacteraceae bacterium]|nr:trehalose-6-phosphate synthase [Bryobacteraceae bacterium]